MNEFFYKRIVLANGMVLLSVGIGKSLTWGTANDNIYHAELLFDFNCEGIGNIIINCGIAMVLFIGLLCISVVLKSGFDFKVSCLEEAVTQPASSSEQIDNTIFFSHY